MVRRLARQLNILKPALLWCSIHSVGYNFRINCCTYQTVTNHCVCVDIEVCTAQFVHLERYLRKTLEQFCNGLGCQKKKKKSPIRKKIQQFRSIAIFSTNFRSHQIAQWINQTCCSTKVGHFIDPYRCIKHLWDVSKHLIIRDNIIRDFSKERVAHGACCISCLLVGKWWPMPPFLFHKGITV